MKSLAALAAVLTAVVASQPALAQDGKKAAGGDTVAELPALPTTSTEDLIKLREQWGTKPSTASADKGAKK